ncbi:TPA: helix-turn-helix domain-containing protein, partial [Burkholderia cenocepacia]
MDEVVGTGRLLSLQDRLVIADGLLAGTSMRSIATELDRSASTITREVAAHRDGHGRYRPHVAHRAAESARARPKESKLAQDGPLRGYV